MVVAGDPSRGAQVPELMRAGAFLIIFFEFVYILESGFSAPLSFQATLQLHLLNICIGTGFFLLTYARRLQPFWREITVFVCASILASSTVIGVTSMRFEPLFVSVMAIVLGVGTLAPWDSSWQILTSAIGVTCFWVLSRRIPGADPNGYIHWLGLATAVGIAQANVQLQMRYRGQIADKMEALEATHRELGKHINAREWLAAEREAALSRLEEREATLRKMFDSALDVITVTRARDGAYLRVNDHFVKVTGYRREEVLNIPAVDVGVWADPLQREDFRRRVSEHGSVSNMELDFRLKNGSMIPTLASAVVIEIDGERCVLTIARDIRDIKESERRLRDSEAKFRRIFDSSLDAMTLSDTGDDRYVDVNEEFLRATGYRRDELVGKNFRELGLWPNQLEWEEFRSALFEKHEVRNLQVNIQTRDGNSIPCLISGVLVELGERLCCLSIVRDISDLKAAERKLQESEATLRKIFDSSLDVMSITDTEDGRWIDVNQEFTRLIGYRKEEVLGRSYAELGIWPDLAERREFVRQLRATGSVRNMEVNFRTRGRETVPCLVSAVVVELGGRPCCVAMARDISERRQVELNLRDSQATLAKARDEALAASKAKSEFLSSMSHEIRTPMNAILGMADLISETELDSEQRRYLDTVISNGNMLLDLINSILDLAKVESGRLSLEAVEFDIRELIEKLAETLAVRAHEKEIELAVRFAANLPSAVIGDPLRLRQVLINLIGNAIKFTDRGEVIVSVALDPATANSGTLLFTVTDTGIGIAKDKLPTIFSVFTQADSSTTRKYGGSGLGLAIVERLVGLMGGQVSAKSEFGIGSTFWFTAKFEIADVASATKQSSPGPDLRGVRALIVDDNATARDIMCDMLGPLGAEIAQAASGADAIRAIDAASSEGAPFGLFLIDSQMPAMSGFQILKRSRRKNRRSAPTVMLLSSHGLTTQFGAMKELGVSDYTVKPIKRHELYAAIFTALQGRTGKSTRPLPEITRHIPALAYEPRMTMRPLSILLTDDSPDNRLLIRAFLKKTPYQLDEAENGQVAVEHFMKANYDLILMDIQMPILDGYGAVRTIRQWEADHHRARVPIIALTASALDDAVRKALDVGCDMHVSKPIKKTLLFDAIARAVEPVSEDAVAAAASTHGGANGPSAG